MVYRNSSHHTYCLGNCKAQPKPTQATNQSPQIDSQARVGPSGFNLKSRSQNPDFPTPTCAWMAPTSHPTCSNNDHGATRQTEADLPATIDFLRQSLFASVLIQATQRKAWTCIYIPYISSPHLRGTGLHHRKLRALFSTRTEKDKSSTTVLGVN